MKDEPIISVKEARKKLGKSYKEYDDQYIKLLIKTLDAIMESYIKSVPKY